LPAGASDRAQAPSQPRGEQTLAAVLVPLFITSQAGPPHIVLTRRRADLRRHAGEISFPGGRKDPGDADLAATALREADEEIGLQPNAVRMLGELPAVSTFATGYEIHPFVGAIEPGQQWRVSAREVDAVLELPLHGLRESRTRTRMERRGITFETDAYALDGHLVWGATFRIIETLLARLGEDGPDGRLSLSDAPQR
jgi:8-oxo-dGTP pyrophosphatase MutT (NUDIX family)